MVYVRIITGQSALDLEEKVNHFLDHTESGRQQIVGYAAQLNKGKYSVIVRCDEEGATERDKEIDCAAIERQSILMLLCKYNNSDEELQQQYGVTRIEAVRRYHLYSEIRGTGLGREVALADIHEVGLGNAAQHQGMDAKALKELYSLEWRELASLFRFSTNRIPYEELAICLKITLEDIKRMDRRLKSRLIKRSS